MQTSTMRSLTAMLESLLLHLRHDSARLENAVSAFERASQVAQRLPLVHRTCKPGAETDWLNVLESRRFAAGEPCTGREKAAGIPRAAYFFLGCGAYPEGLVGFVVDTSAVLMRPASYVPFDSGSIENEKHVAPADPARAAAWDDVAKHRFLEEHLGAGDQVLAFSGPYLAAHFHEPVSYVRLGQRSRTDFPVYHGLRSTNDDRRAWTIEVQVHEDVPLETEGAMLREIVAARWSLVEELPDDMKRFARIASMENEILESIAEGIATRIATEVP